MINSDCLVPLPVFSFTALKLLAWLQDGHPACKKATAPAIPKRVIMEEIGLLNKKMTVVVIAVLVFAHLFY